MSGSVTVPGTGNSSITQTFANQFNVALAQSISNALQAALNPGGAGLTVTGTNGGLAPTNASGKIGELVINPGVSGAVSIPASANWSFVVDQGSNDTIFGSPGLSIMGGGGGHKVLDPSVITLGDSNSTVGSFVTVGGAGDNVAVGSGKNTITGTGSGTMSGGGDINTNDNTFNALGSYVVNSLGFGDTITAGDGATTINSSGPQAFIVGGGGKMVASLGSLFGDANDTLLGGGGAIAVTISGGASAADIVGGSGALTALVSSNADSIFGGTSATAVTLTGSSTNAVVTAGGSALSVLDSGTNDSIFAGTGTTAVTATGGSFVQGGSQPLSFVGGTGPSTIQGGSGGGTIFGSAGATQLQGAAGGTFTYVNTTNGGLAYQAGSGNETIDASLSKAGNALNGGLDPNGSGVLTGGAGNDAFVAGQGAETMFGGGGSNSFYFFAANGGTAANVVIGDFSAIDGVLLTNYGAPEAANALAGATTTGSSTTITLSDNTKITFTGVTNAEALNNHIFSS